MKKIKTRIWPFFLVIVCTLLVALSPLGVRLEESFGLRLLFWLRGPLPAPENVVIVAVDENSATQLELPDPDELSQWPRTIHAQVIDRLTALGARTIAIDIAFHENKNPQEDAVLATAIARADNVVLLKYLEKFTVAQDSSPVQVERVLAPAQQFRDNARAVASFTLSETSIKKYAEVFKETIEGIEPTMPYVALQIFAEQEFNWLAERVLGKEYSRDAIKARPTSHSLVPLAAQMREKLLSNPEMQKTIADNIRADSVFNPQQKQHLCALLSGLLSANPVYLNFYGPRQTITTIPYVDLLKPSGAALDLSDKAVFVGLSEERTKQRDYFYTIFTGAPDRRFSGVEIAATLFANLLEGKQLRSLVGWQILLIIAAIGLLISVGFLRLSLPLWLALSGAVIVIYVTIWYQAFLHFYFWLPLAAPVLLLAPILIILGAAHHHRHSIKTSQVAESTLQHYLPHHVAQQMRNNLEKIQHQREVVQGVCLLTDLEGFTALAEQMPPDQLHALMNRYYQEISQIIQKHNGTIANIVGDGLLALWTGIELNNELKNSACYAALEIVSCLKGSELQGLRTCIGIHCGEISLGNLGAVGHFEYAPVGDTINTTARVEAYNRNLGTQVLFSDAVGADIRLFRTQYHGEVLFKGKTKAVGVYELLGMAPVSNK